MASAERRGSEDIPPDMYEIRNLQRHREVVEITSAEIRLREDIPPDASELMNKLIKHAASFIRVFDDSEPEMWRIVGEFQKIADEVRKMQKRTDTVRTTGAVTGVGLGLMILAAPFTAGLSLLLGAAAAAAGGLVVCTNITKMIIENGSAEEVKQLGEEFMKLVEPLKKDLEEIKTTCEKLEQRSAELQAGLTLSDMEDFQRILTQVSELGRRSEEVFDLAVTVMMVIHDMVVLIVNIFRVTANPEEDKKLRDDIIQVADRCQKIVVEFDKMKKELKDFTEQ